MVKYNDIEWDLTDKQEVDLINAAIEVSNTPIHALDTVYDAGRKLIDFIEREAEDDIYYEVRTEKMEMIEKGLRTLADRVAMLRYKEGWN